jgi:hypothetical protein
MAETYRQAKPYVSQPEWGELDQPHRVSLRNISAHQFGHLTQGGLDINLAQRRTGDGPLTKPTRTKKAQSYAMGRAATGEMQYMSDVHSHARWEAPAQRKN